MIERESLPAKNKKHTGDAAQTIKSAKPDMRAREKRSPAVFLSFLFTAILLTALFAFLGYYPFGNHSILVSDLGAQYAPNLVAYKNQLLDGGFQTYSFLIGMGKNTFGLFAYYLSSPLNFVTFLFPTAMISEAVLVLISIKLSLAAAFMTLFLRRRFQSHSRFSIVFGIMYAFCSYAMIFMINIMWLDGFFLLPLLMFFVEQYLDNHKYWRRVVLTLFVLFVSGFYIAYMVGIFSFLYLLGRLFEKKYLEGEEGKKAGKTVLLFLGSALLAAGMSAAVLVPAGMDILGNPDLTAKEYAVDSNFKFIDFLNQLFAGSFDTLSHNKPLIYCGLAVLFLCAIYFQNPYFSKRQKALAGGAVIFFVLSFNFSMLDLAWQLFDSPNWFLYRYSFLFVFVLLMIAFASILHLKSVKPKSFGITGLVFLTLLLLVQGFGDLAEAGDRFYLNLVLGAIELLCLYAMSEVRFPTSIANLRKLVPALLVVLICIEIVCVNPLFMRNVFGGITQRDPIISDVTEAQTLVAAAKEDGKDDGAAFYRMETDGLLPGSLDPMNAGLYLNYPSISTFNSSANKDLNRLLKQLGYNTNYNYFTSAHTYTSPVADSLLGVRYILSEKENLSGYSLCAASGNGELFLQKNEQALPLFYLVNNDAADFDFFAMEKNLENKNLFLFQDELLVSLFGKTAFSEPVYYQAPVESPAVYNAVIKESEPRPEIGSKEEAISISESISLSESRALADPSAGDTDLLGSEPAGKEFDYGTTYLRMSHADVISITYPVNITSEDPLFLSVPAAARNDQANVYVNGSFLAELSSSSYSQILSLGSFEIGDTVRVSIRAAADTYSVLSVLFYYCDTSLFDSELSAAVSDQAVTITEVGGGYASAEITAETDQLLLTTIPYEKGWTLRVDDVLTQITPYQNALISVPVSEGTHRITLSFTPPGMWAGVITSGVSSLLFVGSLLFTHRKKERGELV